MSASTFSNHVFLGLLLSLHTFGHLMFRVFSLALSFMEMPHLDFIVCSFKL